MKPPAPPTGEAFALVADALERAMLARDLPRVIDIGKIAAELVRIEVERGRRRTAKASSQGKRR